MARVYELRYIAQDVRTHARAVIILSRGTSREEMK